MTSLKLEKGDLVLKTPYDSGLVYDLKATIPPHGRRWDASQKAWIIAYMYGQDVIDVVEKNLGKRLAIPKQVTTRNKMLETRLFKIEYIGAVKERDDGSMSAYAYCDGQWKVVLSLKVLRQWFEGSSKEKINPNDALTFYGILGVKRDATDKEIKKAYRIAAKTWHPDVNDDPGAIEQFRLVQNAYEILRDNRKKYDAGLFLQSQAGKDIAQTSKFSIYRPPKRCGFLTVDGEWSVGRFIVKHILQWDDILDNAGRIMVSYWPKFGDTFEVDWI
jgi:hypothetical protein